MSSRYLIKAVAAKAADILELHQISQHFPQEKTPILRETQTNASERAARFLASVGYPPCTTSDIWDELQARKERRRRSIELKRQRQAYA